MDTIGQANRRAFAFSGPTAAPVVVRPMDGRVGHMTCARWRQEGYNERQSLVLLDGEDVTSDCSEFDDIEGWAKLLERDGHGTRTVFRVGRIEVRSPEYAIGPAVQRFIARLSEWECLKCGSIGCQLREQPVTTCIDIVCLQCGGRTSIRLWG